MIALGVTLAILNFLMYQQKEAHGQLFQYKDDQDYFNPTLVFNGFTSLDMFLL
jgi:hypothetical protein